MSIDTFAQVDRLTVHVAVTRQRRVERKSRQIPHRLTQAHKQLRMNTCHSLLVQPYRKEFLDLVTGDEGWIVYDNSARPAVWLPATQNHQSSRSQTHYNANIFLPFGGTRKGQSTISFWLLVRRSPLPSALISFRSWPMQCEEKTKKIKCPPTARQLTPTRCIHNP